MLTVPNGGNATFGDNTGVVTILDTDGALLAASAPAIPAAGAALDPTVVSAMLDRAIREWIAAGAAPTALAGITFEVVDLPGLKLAEVLGNTITIDVDAAGWGWDFTPDAIDPARIDLLSVLRHEVGHVLGLEHDGDGVMAEELAPGEVLSVPTQHARDLRLSTSTPASHSSIGVHDRVQPFQVYFDFDSVVADVVAVVPIPAFVAFDGVRRVGSSTAGIVEQVAPAIPSRAPVNRRLGSDVPVRDHGGGDHHAPTSAHRSEWSAERRHATRVRRKREVRSCVTRPVTDGVTRSPSDLSRAVGRSGLVT